METMKQFLNFTFTITTLLMLSACANNPSTQSPSNDPNAVMTVVAATMSAMSSPTPTLPAAVPTSTPTVAPTATSMPEPTTLRVVYSRAGEIWIWNEGGEPLKLSNTGIDVQPRISSDGKIVVFARNNELYAVNPDGSDLRKIVSKEYLSQYRPADHKWIWAEHYDWMLDTHMLYFTTMVQFGDEGFPMYQFDLHRVDLDTGVVSNVLPAGQGGVPYFSPNGQTLAVAREDSISLANVDGTGWRVALPFERVRTYSNWVFIPTVVPLPDGNGFRVIIPAYHPDPMDNSDELSKLWNISSVGEPELLHTFSQAGFPVLSPNGNLIVFSKEDAIGVVSLCLYRHNLLTETCAPKTDEQIYLDHWAPDDSKYNYKALNQVPNYYLSSSTEPNSPPIQTEGYIWLTWINPNQYLFIDEEWNLQLATLGQSPTYALIHNGVKHYANVDGILPFDFSTT